MYRNGVKKKDEINFVFNPVLHRFKNTVSNRLRVNVRMWKYTLCVCMCVCVCVCVRVPVCACSYRNVKFGVSLVLVGVVMGMGADCGYQGVAPHL